MSDNDDEREYLRRHPEMVNADTFYLVVYGVALLVWLISALKG